MPSTASSELVADPFERSTTMWCSRAPGRHIKPFGIASAEAASVR
jgi:hypothetical protein